MKTTHLLKRFRFMSLLTLASCFLSQSTLAATAPDNPVKPSVGGTQPDSYPYGEVIRVESGARFTLDAASHSYDTNGKAIDGFLWQELTPQKHPSGISVFPMNNTSAASQTFVAPEVSDPQVYPDTPYMLGLQVKNNENQWSRGHLIWVEVTPKEPANDLVISRNDDYLLYKVSPEVFDSWSNANLIGEEGTQNVKTMTQKIYRQFEDEFDFIWVYLDRDKLPEGRTSYGQYHFISNSVKGLGDRRVSDHTADYGSAGRLKGVSAIYASMNDNNSIMKAMHLDATLHEMFHQYGNFIVPPKTSHWGWHVDGILNGAGTRMNAIEKYLAGYISQPSGEHKNLWDNDSLEIWNEWSNSENFELRSPSYLTSQKNFRGLVVVVTPRTALTDTLDADLSFNINNFTRTDGQHKKYNNGQIESQNFWQATGGEGVGGTIELANLSQVQK